MGTANRMNGMVASPIHWNWAGSSLGNNDPVNIIPGIGYYNVEAQICHGLILDPVDWRELKLGKIIRNENMYDTLQAEYKLHDSIYAFKELGANDSLMHLGDVDDTLYQQFYAFCKAENIGSFEKVNYYMVDSMYSGQAKIINQNIITHNSPEENQKALNAIFLNQIEYEKDTLNTSEYKYDSTETQTLLNIAYQNPISGGNAVFQARAMLLIVVADDENYTRKMRLISKPKETKKLNFNLYPNPNNGNMILEYEIDATSTTVLSIYDVSGRIVKQQTLNAQNKKETITANQLDAGAYYYEIKINDNKVKADKLIIIK
jgi:hypothetical protein